MQLYDTHCHLDFSCFDDDRTEVLDRAQLLGLDGFLVPAVRAATWPALLAWQQAEPRIAIALGLHPFFIEEHQLGDLDILHALLSKSSAQHSLVAVGEIGLDRALEKPLFDKQLLLFERQLQLAVEFDLPVIIHVRKAHPEAQNLLKKYAPRRGGVVHAFSGSFQLAQSYIKLGLKLGIGGVITYPRANKTRQAVTRLPAESLLLETDSPDMPLCGFQGQRNTPERLPRVLTELALLRGDAPDVLSKKLAKNTQQLFDWPRIS